MASVATNKRNLMNADELLKLDNKKEIIMIRGRKPFICNKYMYIKHSDYGLLEDMSIEEQKDIFKDNLYMEKKKKIKKKNLSFRDF